MVKQTNDFDKTLGKNILSYRLAKSISRKELAERIGITHQQMQKYEAGINRVTVSRLSDIGDALEVDMCYLIRMENLPTNSDNLKDKLISEIIGYINLVGDKDKLEAVKNLVKSMA